MDVLLTPSSSGDTFVFPSHNTFSTGSSRKTMTSDTALTMATYRLSIIIHGDLQKVSLSLSYFANFTTLSLVPFTDPSIHLPIPLRQLRLRTLGYPHGSLISFCLRQNYPSSSQYTRPTFPSPLVSLEGPKSPFSCITSRAC